MGAIERLSDAPAEAEAADYRRQAQHAMAL